MSLRMDTLTSRDLAAAAALCPGAFHVAWPVAVARALMWAAVIALTAYGYYISGFSPERLWAGATKLIEVIGHMFPPTAKDMAEEYMYAMLQTIAMAFLGTFIAAILAVPLALLCARNVVALRVVQFLSRRFSDTLRGVDQVIWALIFVRAVGLGPLAGILAIIIADIGTLAKLYSEAIENVEKKPIDGVRACGSNALQTARFGILPQVLPVMLSNALYIFESNTRSATILGIVGAGGIGFYLADRIRTMNWDEASFIMILILISVYLIDWLSKQIRMRLITGRSAKAA
jgi:phosphonate transport system permease protein